MLKGANSSTSEIGNGKQHSIQKYTWALRIPDEDSKAIKTGTSDVTLARLPFFFFSEGVPSIYIAFTNLTKYPSDLLDSR